jgi:3,4-dihydroxy 2-butanone 4-phosphate synthase/GTP cyclohydrolase II
MLRIIDMFRHRRRSSPAVEHFASARIPSAYGEFTAHAYLSGRDRGEHVAYVMGDVSDGEPPLVRVHSECLTGDILASDRCDCGSQLRMALQNIAEEGRGVLVYLRGHEGRGIGIAQKIRAYELQDDGLDTVDANAALGLPVDSRDYGVGAGILIDLGISSLRLMTNNPSKYGSLERAGLRVTERVPIEPDPHPESIRYLETKRERLGHQIGESSAGW